MATCKDCIHNEMCYGTHTDDSPTCCDFKDKSRFIELPCKVGDTVWYITGIGHNLIKSATVKQIIIEKNGVISDLFVCNENNMFFENSFDIFYLTREEAEKALKEREKK